MHLCSSCWVTQLDKGENVWLLKESPGNEYEAEFVILLILDIPVPPHSYSGTGLQAVLELYFAPFLYVCSGISRAKKLSTTSVNIYIALYQLCALSAGFLADKIFGEY